MHESVGQTQKRKTQFPAITQAGKVVIDRRLDVVVIRVGDAAEDIVQCGDPSL
jgi:hypothetical protein